MVLVLLIINVPAEESPKLK